MGGVFFLIRSAPAVILAANLAASAGAPPPQLGSHYMELRLAVPAVVGGWRHLFYNWMLRPPRDVLVPVTGSRLTLGRLFPFCTPSVFGGNTHFPSFFQYMRERCSPEDESLQLRETLPGPSPASEDFVNVFRNSHVLTSSDFNQTM